MTVSNQLVVPVVLWGNEAPTHCISSIFFTRDQKTIITGCNDGQICIWDVGDNLQITPRSLLFGHTAPVLCLSQGSNASDSSLLVSSSETGEMSLWDLTDGRCLEHTKLPYIHTNIQAYHMAGANDVRLFCNGYYAEILVMDVSTLDILFSLSARANPDWISAMQILRPVKRQDWGNFLTDDVVMALSASGTVKIWTLNGTEPKSSEPIYEDESKPIRCLNALKLSCCAYNQRTVLIVCTKYWQIYDATDFSLLCSADNRVGERWTGGDFIAIDRVLIWSDGGKGYLYKLPANTIVENKEFHAPINSNDRPLLYCLLNVPMDERLLCPPAMSYFLTTRGSFNKILLRGDSSGRIITWSIPEVTNRDLGILQQESFDKPPELSPHFSISLQEAWEDMKPPPPGVLDQLRGQEGQNFKLTASVYLPLQGRFVCGREDGSIIIVSASQTVMLHLLYGRHQNLEDWPPHQLLHGHNGRVTCLLYPHHIHNRYDLAHLLSGGVDFSVCLWDIYAGTLLHRFCIHAGEIGQLLVPPNNCNPRILNCVCSVASDHSVALLSLKERKCVLLASRHLFPVQAIKWRPLDDFMVVGCADGSVYIWQMETGHLDRVLVGIMAEEVLNACDEHIVTTGDRLTNPAIHFFRGLRHRNLSAIRHAAQRGLHQLQQPHNTPQQNTEVAQKSHAHPLMLQGMHTNPKDQECHVLFFDIEALIVQLLSEEYSTMSPGSLEAQGLINQTEHQKYQNLVNSPDSHRKLPGFLAQVKHRAENAAQKIQAKAESVGFKSGTGEINIGRKGSGSNSEGSNSGGKKPKGLNLAEGNLTMDIAQLLLSFLHAWGLDADLDRVCESKLGLLRPMRPISYGLLSRGGRMALLLPTYTYKMFPPLIIENTSAMEGKHVRINPVIPAELVAEEDRARQFSSKGHWQISTAMTTHHLLSIISLANTLMSMNSATFIPEQERRRRLQRKLSRADSRVTAEMLKNSEEAENEAMTGHQAQIKQGWSLLAALHCVLLPDLVKTPTFKRPQVEMLARRWQDRCLEVREAAQALLLAELRRIGPKGRKGVVDEWARYLPNYGEGYPGGAQQQQQQLQPGGGGNPGIPNQQQLIQQQIQQYQLNNSNDIASLVSNSLSESNNTSNNRSDQVLEPKTETHSSDEDDEEPSEAEQLTRKPSSTTDSKRRQATAIVLLGVIGAEYGHEIEQSRRRSAEDQKKKSVVEGFGLSNYSLARHTSQALAYLLLAPPSNELPAHTSLRRAAIDLIGRGFTVWEPYLEVSKILLGLLELCCESEKLVPSMSYGLPLTPKADSCRTARHALSLIATARPPAFITTLAREVARYNTLAQNAQSLNIALQNTVLSRARPEILRVVELLIEKMQADVADLLVEVMDIVLHCLDHTQLKSKGLSETFPAICRFHSISYCPSTRRIAVGAKNGNLALYELRASKSQSIAAHAASITACAFSPDGKYLASYSTGENKLCFWQTATGLFGLGNAQTRCVRTYSTPPLSDAVRSNHLKMAKLVWVASKLVILLLCDGTEYRYNVT